MLLWDVERALSDSGSPAVMQGEHLSNIFCVAFNGSNTKLFSGGEFSFRYVLAITDMLLLSTCQSESWKVFCRFRLRIWHVILNSLDISDFRLHEMSLLYAIYAYI